MDGIFSFRALKLREYAGMLPPGERRAEHGAKYLLAFMLFSPTFLDLYCLSILHAMFGLQLHMELELLMFHIMNILMCISALISDSVHTLVEIKFGITEWVLY